jgi:hypothetical protein
MENLCGQGTSPVFPPKACGNTEYEVTSFIQANLKGHLFNTRLIPLMFQKCWSLARSSIPSRSPVH